MSEQRSGDEAGKAMKLYIAWSDDGGCCHLNPPIGVFTSFESAMAAIHLLAKQRGDLRFSVTEVVPDKAHDSESMWPSCKTHGRMPRIPTGWDVAS